MAYFVTFHLADSIPREKAEQIKKERDQWLKNHKEPYSPDDLREYYRLFSQRTEDLLNAGHGSCALSNPENSTIVANAILYFDKERYALDEWVVMPNHVHAIVKPLGGNKLSDILHSWKSYTANEINKLTGKTGQFWMHESYDHIIRNEKSLAKIREYIRNNPEKSNTKVPQASSLKSKVTQASSGSVNEKVPQASSLKGLNYKEERKQDACATLENRLSDLISYSDKSNPFNESETEVLINAIDACKILDPACGSGAFPMGALHKLVHLLGKLDPDNSRWRELQKQKAIRDTEEAFNIGDVKAREDKLKEINETFEHNTGDYGRKLYLIENCIYGVDIQAIAVQISKLRFFISLVVDQKERAGAKNRGIRPLPNLETKFVAANTLIGLEQPKQLALMPGEIETLKNELRQARHRHFEAKSRKEKLQCQKRDKAIRQKIAALLKSSGWQNKDADNIAVFDIYDQYSSATWFDPEWMFGITQGFDIVIGNPPYVRHESIKDLKPQLAKEFGSFYCGTADLYTYFYKKGLDILNGHGHLCFIAPNKFMRAGYGKNTRELLATKAAPKLIIDFGDLPIFDATTYPSILLLGKNPRTDGVRSHKGACHAPLQEMEFLAATFSETGQLEKMEETLAGIGFPMPVSSLRPEGWNLERPEVHALMEKLRAKGKPLEEYVEGKFYYGIKTGLNEAFVIDAATRERLIAESPKSAELIKPWLRGRDIKKWKAEWAGLYLLYIPWHFNLDKYPAILQHLQKYQEQLENRNESERGRYEWYALQRYAADYYKEFERPNIVWGNLATEPKFTFDSTASYVSAPANIIPTNDLFLLSVLNSPICKWWISLQAAIRSGGFLEYKPMYVGSVPVVLATGTQKAPIIERVQAILSDPDSPDVPRLEAEIDQLVYGFYELTEEEIKVVERESKK